MQSRGRIASRGPRRDEGGEVVHRDFKIRVIIRRGMVVGGIRHRANLDEKYVTERAIPGSPWFILADGGGSDGPRRRAWKKVVQDTLCTALGLTPTVSHYPPGSSQWNPVEHRLFSQISRNWAGEPIQDWRNV